MSKYQGCLLGIAIGDALGAPVEFMSLTDIKRNYGPNGISDFDRWSSFKSGTYTDDTQMSLATAMGCIQARQYFKDRGIKDIIIVIYRQYLYWFKSLENPFNIRGPGETCMSALYSGTVGTIEHPINESKGCGGVMRVAPAGLAYPSGSAFKMGSSFAAITHGHPSGYLSAGFLSEIIAHLIEGKTLNMAIDLSFQELVKNKGHREPLKKIKLAQKLADSSKSVEESIHLIGEGWVGEEALAIALYCSLKYPENWGEGVLASVNHSGDSDSTGSITGAILGTLLGVEAIPANWVLKVENSPKIQKIAEDMYRLFQLGENLSYEDYPPD